MGCARQDVANSSRSVKELQKIAFIKAIFCGIIIALWGVSSADRARHSHCRGRGFDSRTLHHME